MKLFSLLAIYALFWVMSAFLVMPFGVKTPDETGEQLVKGQAASAPSNFRPRVIMLRATILAALLCGLFYANYVHGWIVADDLNWVKYLR